MKCRQISTQETAHGCNHSMEIVKLTESTGKGSKPRGQSGIIMNQADKRSKEDRVLKANIKQQQSSLDDKTRKCQWASYCRPDKGKWKQVNRWTGESCDWSRWKRLRACGVRVENGSKRFFGGGSCYGCNEKQGLWIWRKTFKKWTRRCYSRQSRKNIHWLLAEKLLWLLIFSCRGRFDQTRWVTALTSVKGTLFSNLHVVCWNGLKPRSPCKV